MSLRKFFICKCCRSSELSTNGYYSSLHQPMFTTSIVYTSAVSSICFLATPRCCTHFSCYFSLHLSVVFCFVIFFFVSFSSVFCMLKNYRFLCALLISMLIKLTNQVLHDLKTHIFEQRHNHLLIIFNVKINAIVCNSLFFFAIELIFTLMFVAF